MKRRISQIVLMFIGIVLMILPSGIKSLSSGGPGLDFVNYYSYYSPMNFGYGNWGPLITLLLSITVIILLIISVKNDRVSRYINNMLIICIALMAFSHVLFSTFTVISLMVMIIQVIVLTLNILEIYIHKKGEV